MNNNKMITNGPPLQPPLIITDKMIAIKLNEEHQIIEISHASHWLIDTDRGCAWIKPIRHSHESQSDAIRMTTEELKAYQLAVYIDGDSIKMPLGQWSWIPEGYEHLLMRPWQADHQTGFINLTQPQEEKITRSLVYQGDEIIAEISKTKDGYKVYTNDDNKNQFFGSFEHVKTFVNKLKAKKTQKKINVFLPIIMFFLLISSLVLNQSTCKAAEIGITVEKGVYQINDKTYINKGDWLGLFTDADELIYMMPVDERMINKIEIDEDAPFPVLALDDGYYAPVGWFHQKEEQSKPTKEQIQMAEELKKLIIRKLHEIVKGVAPWLIWN